MACGVISVKGCTKGDGSIGQSTHYLVVGRCAAQTTTHMTQAEFRAALASDQDLQTRFILDPKAVLNDYQVSDELSDADLDSITGGSLSEPEFVHSLLTTIFEKGG